MDEIISESFHTARKAHICENCTKPIEPGQRYRYRYGKVEGDLYTVKEHEECVAFCNRLIDEGYADDTYPYISDWPRTFDRYELPDDLWEARARIMGLHWPPLDERTARQRAWKRLKAWWRSL